MFNEYFNELISKILDVVAIDTVQAAPCSLSPFGEGVGKCLDYLDKYCTSLGFKTHNEDGYYLTATIGEGEEFGVLGHVDTVPYIKSEWSSNPLGEIKNNTLYGRGVLDDKGPMLCCLFAVKQLLDEGYKLKKKIKFIFGGNEESGWGCIKRFNEKDTMPEYGISPDADFPVINCEKGIAEIKVLIDKPKGLIKIRGGERSNVVISECNCVVEAILDKPKDINVSIAHSDKHTYIKALGKAAHGSTPEKGDNALFHILNYLSEYSEDSRKLKNLLCHTDGTGLDLAIKDKVSGKLSCNVGVVKDIEDKIEITLDIRFPISYTKEFIAEKVSKAFNSPAKITHYHDPLYVDKKDPLVCSLMKSYEKVTGQKLKPITIGGGTYARALKKGVAFGPIFPNQESTIHQMDERVLLDDLYLAYKVYLEAFKKICFE